MPRFVSAVASRGFKCFCGERVNAHERYTQETTSTGKVIKHCRFCESPSPDPVHEDDGEEHLRQMEDYAAYRAAGATESYWQDRDAGFCH